MNKAVMLLSGGLDSATTLAIARSAAFECHCLTLDYGQRHRAEIAAAARVATALDAGEHRVIPLDLSSFGGSALTDAAIAVPESPAAGIPVTYVPARNTIFLSFALALAERVDSQNIFFGANQLDYSGYPDCREEYIRAFEQMANLATKAGVEGKSRLRIQTPLLQMTKGKIIATGMKLGLDYGLTWSCYDPLADGRACARCDSCKLRRKGFREAGSVDPISYAAG
jgi:7-cyano-7-deazaguanine synthase